MQEDYSQFVPDVTFEKIPIKNLVSNQAYQRNISHIHVSRTADNFNLRQINPVKVSRRDGINYVFNGQHTAETVARLPGARRFGKNVGRFAWVVILLPDELIR